jgi:phosphatidylglycerophosphatase A
MQRIYRIVATFFGLGYLPLMPGTWGSLAGVVLFGFFLNSTIFLFLTILIISVGFFVSDKVSKARKEKDPQIIVIDEVAGQMITYLGVLFSWKVLILGFVLFRFFDIVKPLGIKRVEKVKGSSGIMLDDIVAGIYANIVLRIIIMVW